MDPASATVALVGFAASLATLTGLLAGGLQKLWTLKDKLDHSPAEYKRLRVAVATLRALFVSVHALLQDECPDAMPLLTLQSWRENAEQMMKDLHAFDSILEKCCPDIENGQTSLGYQISGKEIPQ